MEEFLKFGRFLRECVKIQGSHAPLADAHAHLTTRNPKFWIEIDPGCGEDLFFGLHLNLGAKFPTKIELLSLTKRRYKILPPRNLLNQKKIDAYGTTE